MAVHMMNCCFCIPLRIGVVIITIISLIYGICMTVKFGLYLTSQDQGTNAQQYNKGYTYLATVIYGSMAIGAIFGLFIVICANKSRMLSLYSKIAFLFAGIDIMSVISGVVVIVLNREVFLDSCVIFVSSDGTSQNIDMCTQEYNKALTLTVVTSIISILLAVYFAMVIKAYSNKRREKENRLNAPNDDLP